MISELEFKTAFVNLRKAAEQRKFKSLLTQRQHVLTDVALCGAGSEGVGLGPSEERPRVPFQFRPASLSRCVHLYTPSGSEITRPVNSRDHALYPWVDSTTPATGDTPQTSKPRKGSI